MSETLRIIWCLACIIACVYMVGQMIVDIVRSVRETKWEDWRDIGK